MSFISQSTNNSPWNHALTARYGPSFWILSIGRKEPKTVQQVRKDVSSQQLTVKMQQSSLHHRLQRQEHWQNKYSIK